MSHIKEFLKANIGRQFENRISLFENNYNLKNSKSNQNLKKGDEKSKNSKSFIINNNLSKDLSRKNLSSVKSQKHFKIISRKNNKNSCFPVIRTKNETLYILNESVNDENIKFLGENRIKLKSFSNIFDKLTQLNENEIVQMNYNEMVKIFNTFIGNFNFKLI